MKTRPTGRVVWRTGMFVVIDDAVHRSPASCRSPIPKRIAEQYGIAPGDDIDFVPTVEGVRLVPAKTQKPVQLSREERLRLFDAAIARQAEREKHLPTEVGGRRPRLQARGPAWHGDREMTGHARNRRFRYAA